MRRRHINACQVTGTRLTYPEHITPSGICSICVMDMFCEIGKKARTGDTIYPEPFGCQFGAEKITSNLEDLQIIPELYGKQVLFFDTKTETKIGGLKSKVPLIVSAMGSTKVAADRSVPLSIGAAMAGIPLVIGENMLQTHGKKGLKERIDNYLDNFKKYGGVIVQGNTIDIKCKIFETGKELGAHGIEIKLGQGAKQGLGGEIQFRSDDHKIRDYKKLGYQIINNPNGTFQRHTPPGSLVNEELRNLLIKYSELGLPIWAKIAVGKGIIKLIEFLEKIKKEQGIPFKCITVDGLGGGTGMSPWLIMNETTLPSASLFSSLNEKPSFDILLAGGYNSGIDIAKGLMLGANGIAMGRAFLVAASAIKKRDEVEPSKAVENFVKAVTKELQMVCATQRVNSVSKLIGRRENLYSLSEDAELMFGIPRKIKNVL